MFLYKKQKEEFHSVNNDNEKGVSDDNGKPAVEVAAEDTLTKVNNENDEPPNNPEEPMDMEVDHAVVKQEDVPESTVAEVRETPAHSSGVDMEVDLAVVKQEDLLESTVAEVRESPAHSSSGGLLPCKVEEATADVGGGNGDSSVLSGVSTAEVAVMPTESIEFDSVNLNRIHHHSPESTH